MAAARRRFADFLSDDASLSQHEGAQSLLYDKEGKGGAEALNGSHLSSISDKQALLDHIEETQVGAGLQVKTPFGHRKITFADYTASGRALAGIEDVVRQVVLPHYANTHTTASATGMQTTLFRAEARSFVRRSINAENNKDTVLFTGTGCTGAVVKMLQLLQGTARWRNAMQSSTPPLVIVGPYEHHSNLLPWRESGAKLVEVREAPKGGVDIAHLSEVLGAYSAWPLKIGTFSAASNITGILTDTVAVAATLHKHGALAFFDYASAGPYCDLDMNPVVPGADASLAYKDAMFLSPHKLVGGVGTPGVLAFKKSIIDRGIMFGVGPAPACPGGGTVFFVTPRDHRYLENLEEREEGGTPDIVGAIRCGLAFRVKEAVGSEVIMAREREHLQRALRVLGAHEKIDLYGQAEAERVAIVSFNVRHAGRFLHHNLVATLLNDLFGIQVRAGCSCAGPYAEQLLGIEYALAKEYESALLQGDELVRPGFVRLNFNYFMSEQAARFVVEAVSFIADHGWKLLPAYTFVPASAEWRHRVDKKFALRDRRWLSHLTFKDGKIAYPGVNLDASASTDSGRLGAEEAAAYLEHARRAVAEMEQAAKAGKGILSEGGEVVQGGWGATEAQLSAESKVLVSPEASRLRWFLLPSEALALLLRPDTRSIAGLVVRQNPYVPEEAEGGVQGAGAAGGEALSAFERFALQQQQSLLARHPQATFHEVLEVAGKAWSQLGDAERKRFAEAAPPEAATNGAPSSMLAPALLASSQPPALPPARASASDTNHAAAVGADAAEVLQPQALFAQAEEGPEGSMAPSGGGEDGAAANGIAAAAEEREADASKSEGGAQGAECRTGKCGARACSVNGSGGSSAVCLRPNGSGGDKAKPAAAVAATTKGGVDKKRVQKAEKKLMSAVGKAIQDFNMIKDGDRVLVGLSGGKDSLSLLHVLLQLKRKAPIHFDVGACTVDPQTPEYNPSILKEYLKTLGVPYFYESQAIIEQASCSMDEKGASICSFCSRMKRGILYTVCKREGYSVLALGQHLDDQAESMLMSAFHNGQLRTMKAHYRARDHDVRIVRPLNYAREAMTREYAEAAGLPVITDNCPGCFEAPKERARVKMVLASQEQLFPDLYGKLLKAMLPLMASECEEEAPVVQELRGSKHAAERNIVGAANNGSESRPAAAGGKGRKGARTDGAAGTGNAKPPMSGLKQRVLSAAKENGAPAAPVAHVDQGLPAQLPGEGLNGTTASSRLEPLGAAAAVRRPPATAPASEIEEVCGSSAPEKLAHQNGAAGAKPSGPAGGRREAVAREVVPVGSRSGSMLAASVQVLSGGGEGVLGALLRVFNSVGGAMLLWRL